MIYTEADITKAKNLATNMFNDLPYETRKKLANSAERLWEIDMLLHEGDSLCMHDIKKRKKNWKNG